MKDENFGCLIIFIVSALIFLASYGFGSYECMVKAVKQDMAYSYGIIQGCMVKKDGKWIDYDRLRVMD